jgi:predicted amidophosphoribosyltransferase
MDIPFSSSLMEKHRSTDPQVNQTLRQRKKNVKGSFRISGKVNANNIAIVDDVVTTGSTAAEITKILKLNGVDYVQVWGVAHTV